MSGNTDFTDADAPGAAKLPFDREEAVRIARLYPRDTSKALRKLLKRAKDPAWAALATYPVERDGETIYRPSVNLARPVAEELGDIKTGFRIVSRGGDFEQIEGWAFDATTRREDATQEPLCLLLKGERGKEPRRMDEKQARAARNALGAVLVRNALLHILPSEFVQRILDRCALTIEGDAEERVVLDPARTAHETMGLILKAGGTLEQVERFIGHSLEQYTAADELALRGILRRVDEGFGTLSSFFEAVETAESSFAPPALEQPGAEPVVPRAPAPAPVLVNLPSTPDLEDNDAWSRT